MVNHIMAAATGLRVLRQLSETSGSWRIASSRFYNCAAGEKPPTESNKIPVTEAETTEKVPEKTKMLVLGGNGFVGSHVCKEAVQRGIPVISFNRSGKPQIEEPWVARVDWVRGITSTSPNQLLYRSICFDACLQVFADAGNLLSHEPFGDLLNEVSSVVSCVGAFGSNETMRKINGDANINAVDAAADAGVKRFVYISASDFGFGSYLLRGYFEGKKAAENAVRSKFPYGGVILRPGFIYGYRRVGGIQIPLSAIGAPLEMVMKNMKAATQIPLLGQVVVPPVKVTAVAKTAVRSAIDNAVPPGVLDAWGILRFGDH